MAVILTLLLAALNEFTIGVNIVTWTNIKRVGTHVTVKIFINNLMSASDYVLVQFVALVLSHKVITWLKIPPY